MYLYVGQEEEKEYRVVNHMGTLVATMQYVCTTKYLFFLQLNYIPKKKKKGWPLVFFLFFFFFFFFNFTQVLYRDGKGGGREKDQEKRENQP